MAQWKGTNLDTDTNTPYLAAQDLVVRYPPPPRLGFGLSPVGHIALDQFSFEVKSGTRLGVIGQNGAGKSTLLRTLAGVYPPESGELILHGRRASVFSATSGFMPSATGYENIFLRGTLLGFSYERIRALIPEIIEFAGLGEWIDQPLFRYSSGMTLRLAFAITTCIDAEILLLDEWLGAGDAEFVERARARMDQVLAKTSILILATHNLKLMQSICDEAIILSSGTIAFRGEVKEAAKLYARMKNGTARVIKTERSDGSAPKPVVRRVAKSRRTDD
jgi:lipopolysaccharide transport system ATP-binding protein